MSAHAPGSGIGEEEALLCSLSTGPLEAMSLLGAAPAPALNTSTTGAADVLKRSTTSADDGAARSRSANIAPNAAPRFGAETLTTYDPSDNGEDQKSQSADWKFSHVKVVQIKLACKLSKRLSAR